MNLIEIDGTGPIWRQRYEAVRTVADEPVEARMWEYANGFRESWHDHSQAQMIYVTRGVLQITTPAGMWTLTSHHGLWLPPTMLHELYAIGDVEVRTAYIDAGTSAELERWSTSRMFQVSPLLDALHGVLATRSADVDTQRARLALPLFLLELSRAQVVLTGALPLPHDRRLRSICEQMLTCPENNDTIERWGERVGASTRTLARLFREETGLSFGQWRQQLRLVEAIARLALGRSVSVIATELGYQSSSAFISMFRKTLGETPQRYLRRGDTV
ncbi:AraC-type DNA-binding protein [Pararobbsia alpina]|uniref:AraC family transcriptional regulator n=1 Tax=Pararobbsia alpina TaxID=621374 RepID=UPI0039A49CD8